MKKTNAVLFLVFSTLLSVLSAQDWDSIKFITSDIDNFLRGYEQLQPGQTHRDSVKILFENYYLNASEGLEEFTRLRTGSIFNYLRKIAKRPNFYASIKETTTGVAKMEPEIRNYLKKFKEIYPDAVFTDVYFFIGIMNSGGTLTENGLYLGTELYSKTPDTPMDELNDWERAVLKPVDYLPAIVVHELMHLQQVYAKDNSVLAHSIKEGSCDFVTYLVTGKNINDHVHAWAKDHQKEIWTDFKNEMDSSDYSNWLYNGSNIKDRPADLGYYTGYVITEAYYNQAKDKQKALKEIFNIHDFKKFFEDSGVSSKFNE